MRVIAGTARRLPLVTPKGMETRPTTDRIKETLFNILQNDLPGCHFLDLFAGSGQMGIEAISRGAKKAVFVDSSKKSLQVVNENIEKCKFQDKSKVVNGSAVSFLKMNKEKFDIAFLDPPYHKGLVEKAMPLLVEKMSENGIISCETARDEELPERFGDFTVWRSRAYGKIKLTVYRKDGKE